jgi:Glycosyltransferases involved in cell wall biogenesis
MLISIVIPAYNEESNILARIEEIVGICEKDLSKYSYEVIVIDNASTDRTPLIIRRLCAENPNVKAIFNSRNVGVLNSQYYGLCQANGDCAICIFADFQEPAELIPVFVKEWEDGNKVVCGIKLASEEKKYMYLIRSLYYKMLQKMSDTAQIEHYHGFGLFDRSFLDIMKSLDDTRPFLRGIVAELAYDRKDIVYTQLKRRAGKSFANFYRLYDMAMLGFTSYTRLGLRGAIFIGLFFAVISFLIGMGYFIAKIIYWDSFTLGTAPALIGIFLFNSILLLFIGLLGEYCMHINNNTTGRPLVIERERLNFD